MKNVTKMLTRLMMLLAFSVLFFSQSVWADRVITIGTGATTLSTPFRTNYEGARSQMVYPASLLTGLSAGQINAIALNVATVGSPAMTNLTFNLRNTTGFLTDFISTGMTQCLVLPSYAAVAGWNTFTFTTPFIWDGTSDVLVEICFGQNPTFATNSLVYATNVTSANPPFQMLMNRVDAPGCTLPSVYYNTAIPDLQLTQYTGTLSGVVTGSNTLLPIVGATITGGGSTATTLAGGAYTMTATVGSGNFIGAAANYSPKTQSATLTHGGTTTLNFVLDPAPAYLTGHITNAATGAPIKGAKVVVNGNVTYSIEGGLYNLSVFPGGSYPAVFTKAGYSDTTTAAITLTSGITTTFNMAMKEFPNPASTPFTAALNTGATQVNLNWGIPKGNYELIYDDGVPDTTIAWSFAGNMNAVKFTVLNGHRCWRQCQYRSGK